jgi:phosphatidylglycerol:prolipoprotein diacylglycerol transferase
MHPILVRIPLPGWKFLGDLSAIPIHSYGVMLGLSLVASVYRRSASRKGQAPKETLANCYVFTALSAVVMSRVLYT